MLTVKSDLVKTRIPRLPFTEIAGAILGSSYELSVVFVGDTRSAKLNNTYRGKNKPTNILSFPYDETSGEIVIDISLVAREASTLKRSLPSYLGYIFIHGCLHLAGLDHGHIMEDKETHYLHRFDLL